MGKPVMKPAKVEINKIDIKIILAVGLCVLTSTILKQAGCVIAYGGRNLEIIQAMTASISCLLCVQENGMESRNAGRVRIKVTIAAAIMAIVVVLLDTLIGNVWISIPLIMLGVLATMFLCKLWKAPYMNCRIGGVNFVLMACTLSENARLLYTGFRVLSTFYGVFMVLLVTYIFDKATTKRS